VSVLCNVILCAFTALILLVVQQEGYLAGENVCFKTDWYTIVAVSVHGHNDT